MVEGKSYDSDNEALRRRSVVSYGPELANDSTLASDTANLSGVMNNANIGASYNAPVRAQVMQEMQHTQGNRAVQRAISASRPAGGVPVQRDTSGLEGPMYGPMLPPVYGPALEPAGIPYMSQQRDYGGVSVMEDDDLKASVLQENRGGVSVMESQVPGTSYPQQQEDSSPSPVGDINNGVSAVTTATNMAMISSPLFRGLPGLAEDFNILSLGKGGSGMLNNGSSALGVGMGLYNFATAKNNSERVQAGADTLASGAGFAGPVGMAFSGGYSAGQLLDKGADWIGDRIWGEGDHSLHHGMAEHVLPHILPPAQDIRDGWDVLWGNGTEAQRENGEKRADEVEYEHLRDARKDREQKAQDDAEMAEMRSQMEHPHIGGTMMGTPGDALSGSSIAAQFMPHDVDEDGVPLPPVSMALPEPTTKRRH